jgi:hypothetical protein
MLAQWEGILAPEVQTEDASGQSLWSAIADQTAQFLADYQAWAAGGREGLAQTAADLQAVRVELGTLRQTLQAAGDMVNAAALATPIEQVDAAQADVRTAQEQADQYGGVWDTLYQWLTAMGGGGLGLVFIPIALSAAAAVAAIAALAYVLRTWRDNADRAAYLRDLASKVSVGQLSAQQAATLADSYTPPSASLFGELLGGLSPVVLLVGAGVLVFTLRN